MTAMRLAGNKNGNTMARLVRAMATASRVASNKEGAFYADTNTNNE